MCEVYEIVKTELNNNSYRCDREEFWRIKKVRDFIILEEARQFIIEKSIIHTDLVLYTVGCDGEERDKMIERFCFTDDIFLPQRKYFIGKPPVDNIKKAIVNSGVKLIES